MCAPFHVINYCNIDEDDNTYQELVNEYQDKYHFVYKIKCSCCNDKFEVYKDDHPTVLLRCTNCANEIVAYDLKYYPAAVKLNVDLEMKKVVCQNSDKFNVYCMYEYAEEFYEVDFDENDITACMVFIRSIDDDFLNIIVDDETA